MYYLQELYLRGVYYLQVLYLRLNSSLIVCKFWEDNLKVNRQNRLQHRKKNNFLAYTGTRCFNRYHTDISWYYPIPISWSFWDDTDSLSTVLTDTLAHTLLTDTDTNTDISVPGIEISINTRFQLNPTRAYTRVKLYDDIGSRKIYKKLSNL